MSDPTVPFGLLRATVKSILEHGLDHEWSVQGFGMLRTYLDAEKRYRLNLWDSAFAVPNVSIIHTHPWDFRSWIASGEFTNIRYSQVDYDPGLPPYNAMLLTPGDQGGPITRLPNVFLVPNRPENFTAGGTYAQRSQEIHASYYTDGTVTINDRTGRGPKDEAIVYWMHGSWVDAKPRNATFIEIQDACGRALALFEEPRRV